MKKSARKGGQEAKKDSRVRKTDCTRRGMSEVEAKRVPNFGDTLQIRSARTDGKFAAMPFSLPGHFWILAEWLPDFKPEAVILTFENIALVRDGAKRSVHASPSKSEKATCAWSKERYRQEFGKFLTTDRDMLANLVGRARRNKSGVKPIAWKAEHLIDELFALAREGNQKAAAAVAELLRKWVSQLSQLAKSNLELLRPVARKSWKWPVMKSIHPLLSDEDFLGSLALGRDLPFYFDDRSKWRFDDFTKIAFGILVYVWRARKENRGPFLYYRIGELADELPQFRKGPHADQWWRIAEAVFLFSYPNPEAIPELGGLIDMKKRTPGRVRHKILERIKQHFLNFAKP